MAPAKAPDAPYQRQAVSTQYVAVRHTLALLYVWMRRLREYLGCSRWGFDTGQKRQKKAT
ncbi:MAG: hypothetical protein AAGH48_03465 [Pseudomonadota bacterium]